MAINPEDVLRVVLAVLVGGLIGAEREYRDKAAGFRTIIFITLGSTLFTLFSMHIGGADDPVRIAAQIVTGIGFIGAGAILRGEHGITGLTTAATIWLSAALGLGIGGGDLGLVLIATIAIMVVLWIFPFLEHSIDRMRQVRNYEIVIAHDPEMVKKIEQYFPECKVKIYNLKRFRKGSTLTLHFISYAKPSAHEQLTARLLAEAEVQELRY